MILCHGFPHLRVNHRKAHADPVDQIVGYIITGDPTYITSYKNARSLIRRVERDELLEEFVRFYVNNIEKTK